MMLVYVCIRDECIGDECIRDATVCLCVSQGGDFVIWILSFHLPVASVAWSLVVRLTQQSSFTC